MRRCLALFFCFDCELGLLSIFTPPLHNAVVLALHSVSASEGWILEPGDFDAELVRRGASRSSSTAWEGSNC